MEHHSSHKYALQLQNCYNVRILSAAAGPQSVVASTAFRVLHLLSSAFGWYIFVII